MAYNVENSIAGIKANGREWKATIRGIPDINRQIEEAKGNLDAAKITELMRSVGVKFKAVWNEEKATMGQQDDLEWFLDDNAEWFLELYGDLDSFEEEYNYRLSSLYDYADYNRIWVSPERDF